VLKQPTSLEFEIIPQITLEDCWVEMFICFLLASWKRWNGTTARGWLNDELICNDCRKSRESDRVAEDKTVAVGDGAAESSSDDEPIKAPTELLVEVNCQFVHFITNILQGSYRPWKVLKLKCWDFQAWKVLEKPGLWSLQVLESTGKQCFNVCTNHDTLITPASGWSV